LVILQKFLTTIQKMHKKVHAIPLMDRHVGSAERQKYWGRRGFLIILGLFFIFQSIILLFSLSNR